MLSVSSHVGLAGLLDFLISKDTFNLAFNITGIFMFFLH
jgi:hypothetical protein